MLKYLSHYGTLVEQDQSEIKNSLELKMSGCTLKIISVISITTTCPQLWQDLKESIGVLKKKSEREVQGIFLIVPCSKRRTEKGKGKRPGKRDHAGEAIHWLMRLWQKKGRDHKKLTEKMRENEEIRWRRQLADVTYTADVTDVTYIALHMCVFVLGWGSVLISR